MLFQRSPVPRALRGMYIFFAGFFFFLCVYFFLLCIELLRPQYTTTKDQCSLFHFVRLVCVCLSKNVQNVLGLFGL